MPSLGSTRIDLPSIKSGWCAGQYVRIRILSSEMGIRGWPVAHPFSIANVPGMCGSTGMVLIAKKTGAWTTELYHAASRMEDDCSEKGAAAGSLRVLVEGPYGGTGAMIMSSYTSALLVGGGSGITFVLAQAEELVRDITLGRSSVCHIELIWTTQDEGECRR